MHRRSTASSILIVRAPAPQSAARQSSAVAGDPSGPNKLDLADLALFGEGGHRMFRLLVGRARSAAWLDGRVQV
jgi:hypothetical protein